jgi:hypothetical protein
MRAKPSVIRKARKLFEATVLPATQIGAAVGLSPATVRRRAKKEDWQRPDEPGPETSAVQARKRPVRRILRKKAPALESAPAAASAAVPALSTAERCRELLLRVLAAAEGHIAVVEQRLALRKLDVAAREKEVRVIAVLTRLVNDINHVLGTPAPKAPRADASNTEGEDGIAQSPDRARQDFADRLDALLGADPAGGLSETFAGHA